MGDRDGGGVRVLHVDDDAAFADVAAAFLERHGLDVVTETAVDDALARLGTPGAGGVDCVVSDYNMPEVDGIEFLRRVRETHPDLPFVLFTGRGSEEVASEAISAGVTEYMQKGGGTDQYEVLANRVRNAVERYRAERGLERSETRYRRLVEQNLVGIYVIRDDEFEYVNPKLAEIFGYEQSELVGRGPFDLVVEEEHDLLRENLRRRERGEVEDIQYTLTGVRKDGERIEVEVHGGRVETGDGPAIVGALVDVTDRVREDDAQRDLARKVEGLHDVATRLHACTTADEVFDAAIEAALDILGFDWLMVATAEDGAFEIQAATEQAPVEAGQVTFPVDEGRAGEALRTGESLIDDDVHAVGNPVAEEFRSGVTVPIGDVGVFQGVSSTVHAFDEDDLRLAELLVSHLQEAYQRVERERTLREREAELVDERDRLVALFDNIPDPAVAYVFRDGDPIAVEVNDAFERTFGYDAGAVRGENVDQYIVPTERAEEAEELNRKLQAGESLHVETRRRTDDGVRDILLHVVPLELGASNVEGFAIYTDITEQKQRERDLERQNDRLAAFAAVVSHDLRNPLAVAQGHLDLLRERHEDDHVDAIGTALDRMEDLIADVLTLARDGQTIGATEPVALRDAVEDAWSTVDGDGDGELVADVDDVRVVADRGRLRQLFENLLRNSVEHAGSDVTVEVGLLPDGFFVADDGPGIPADQRERVLDPGYTTRGTGTGLGLAIVADVADAHGWSLAVEGSETGGARFAFTGVESVETPE